MKKYKVVSLLSSLVIIVIANNKWQAMKQGISWFGTTAVKVLQ